jgi:hypothetical protein
MIQIEIDKKSPQDLRGHTCRTGGVSWSDGGDGGHGSQREARGRQRLLHACAGHGENRWFIHFEAVAKDFCRSKMQFGASCCWGAWRTSWVSPCRENGVEANFPCSTHFGVGEAAWRGARSLRTGILKGHASIVLQEREGDIGSIAQCGWDDPEQTPGLPPRQQYID